MIEEMQIEALKDSILTMIFWYDFRSILAVET